MNVRRSKSSFTIISSTPAVVYCAAAPVRTHPRTPPRAPPKLRTAPRYREDWVLNKPEILKCNGWGTSFSEVLISTPRRFGKTFAVAIFIAVVALSVPLEVVVFSPARRASRKLLERVYEVRAACGRGGVGLQWGCTGLAPRAPWQFIRLLDSSDRITEYNQEVLRVRSYDEGKTSLVRSFPSKVGVRTYGFEPVSLSIRRGIRIITPGSLMACKSLKSARVATMILFGAKVSTLDHIMSLMKSRKGPSTGYGLADHLRNLQIREDEETAVFLEVGCHACGAIATLCKTKDGGESCVACGAVRNGQKLVSLTHNKACSQQDDPTTCADDPRTNVVPVGFESPNDAAARHYFEAGGSSLSGRARKRLGCCSAENRVKRQAVKDYRQHIAVSASTLRLNRAVQIQLHAIFEQAGPLHEQVLSHIRRTSYEVIVRSQAHVDLCAEVDCDLDLSNISAQTLATTLIHVICDQLRHTMGDPDHPLYTYDVGTMELTRLMDVAVSYSGNQGGVAFARAIQGIRLNMCNSANGSCAPPCKGPKMLTTLSMESMDSVESNMSAVSTTSTTSTASLSGSPIPYVRNSMWEHTQNYSLTTSLRDYCLRIVASGCIDNWIRSVCVPHEVLGAVLLSAGASRIGGTDEKRTYAIALSCAKRHEVTETRLLKIKREAVTSIATLFTDLEDDDL